MFADLATAVGPNGLVSQGFLDLIALNDHFGDLADGARSTGPEHSEDGKLGVGRFLAERAHAGDYLRRSS